jgi:hypothetical protein
MVNLSFVLDDMPPSLVELKLTCINGKRIVLPPTIQHVTLTRCYHLDITWPTGTIVQSLYIDDCDDISHLPQYVKSLTIRWYGIPIDLSAITAESVEIYTKHHAERLPKGIKRLTYRCPNQDFMPDIYNGIETIIIIPEHRKLWRRIDIPDSVKTIIYDGELVYVQRPKRAPNTSYNSEYIRHCIIC